MKKINNDVLIPIIYVGACIPIVAVGIYSIVKGNKEYYKSVHEHNIYLATQYKRLAENNIALMEKHKSSFTKDEYENLTEDCYSILKDLDKFMKAKDSTKTEQTLSSIAIRISEVDEKIHTKVYLNEGLVNN